MEMVLDTAVVMMTMGSLQNVQADLILMLVGITKQSQLLGGQKETFRLCGHKLLEKCVSDTLPGVSATICNCDTDNCNKDHECDCSLITSTQGTTQDWDKTTWTTQATTKTTSSTTTQTTTKTTATSSSSTIGISALASLVSTTASLLISLSS